MAVPVITNNSPAPGYISWGAFTIQLNGVAYSVAAGSTNQKWVWWEYRNGAPVITAGPTIPDGVKNLLLNSDFAVPEPSAPTLPLGWKPSGWYNAGNDSMLHNATNKTLELKTLTVGADGPSAEQLVPTPVVPGGTYRATARVSGSAAGGGLYFGLLDGATGAELTRFGNMAPTPGLTTTPATYTGLVVIPAGVTSVRVAVLSYNQVANFIATVDDFSFGVEAQAPLVDEDLLLFANKNGIGARIQSSNFVDGELLVDGSIFADALSTNLINTSHIVAGGIDAGVVKFGAMSGDRIDVGTLQASRIKSGDITALQIKAGTITATEIATDTITAAKIATGAITADELAVGAVTAEKIHAGAVTAETLAADIVLASNIATGSTGQDRVLLNARGLHLLAADGSVRADLPTNSAEQAFIKGAAELDSLTINDNLSMHGGSNTLEPGSVLKMKGSVSNPTAAPNAYYGGDAVVPWYIPGHDYSSWGGRGMTWDGGAYVTVNFFYGTQLMRWNEAGQFSGNVTIETAVNLHTGYFFPYGGVTYYGGYYYVLGFQWSTASGKDVWQVRKYSVDWNASTFVLVQWMDIGSRGIDFDGSGKMPIIGKGIDTGVAMAWWGGDANGFKTNIQAIDTGTCARFGASAAWGAYFQQGALGDYKYLEQQNFDLGAPRTMFAWDGLAEVQVHATAAGGKLVNEVWSTLSAAQGGIAYNPSSTKSFRSFYFTPGGTGFMVSHTVTNWVDAPDFQKYWATFTYRNATSGFETMQSLYASFTMAKRTKLSMSAPSIPPGGTNNDPNSVRFWVGRGAVAPARTAMFLFATPAVGVISASSVGFTLTGANPPAGNTFPASAAATLLDANGNPLLDSSGNIGNPTVAILKGLQVWAGSVRLDSPPFFHGSLTNVSQPITAGTPVPYGVVEDSAGTWVGTSGNFYWVIPVAGVYRICYGFKVNGTPVAPVHIIMGGAAGSTQRFYQPNIPAAGFGGGNFSWTGRFAANDRVRIWLGQNNYTTQPDGAGVENNFFTAEYVRA